MLSRTRKASRVETHYVVTEEGVRVLVPGDPTPVRSVVGWAVWHTAELAGVLVPAGIAVAVTPWAWLVSGAVAAGWTVHATRQAREQAAITSGQDIPAPVDAGTDAPSPGTGVDAATGPAGSDTVEAPASAGVSVEGVWL